MFNGVKMTTKLISLRLDEGLIFQIKEFAAQSGMTQTELTKLWIIKGLAESKNDIKKDHLRTGPIPLHCLMNGFR